MKTISQHTSPTAPDRHAIEHKVVETFGLESVEQMLSRIRWEHVATGRMMTWFLLRTWGLPWIAIAKMYGRDPGTIIHGTRRIAFHIATDKLTRRRWRAVRHLASPEYLSRFDDGGEDVPQ